jgi:hypothetical protein
MLGLCCRATRQRNLQRPVLICLILAVFVCASFAADRYVATSPNSSPLDSRMSTESGNVSITCSINQSSCPHRGGPINLSLPINTSTSNNGNGSGLLTQSLGSSPSTSLGYNGLYWMGTEYAGTSFTAPLVWATITTPSSGPRVGDEYFLLVSVFDSKGYYDQFGLASVASSGSNSWQATWSVAGSCGTSLSNYAGGYVPVSTYPITPGTEYTYEMYLTGSQLEFIVNQGQGINSGGNLVATFPDTSSVFQIAQSFPCGGQTYGDFTDYEEVHKLVQGLAGQFPQWVFQFYPTYGGQTALTSWQSFAQAGGASTASLGFPCPCVLPVPAHGYYTSISPSGNGAVQIANQAYAASFPWSATSVARGHLVSASGHAYSVGSYCNVYGYQLCGLYLNCAPLTGMTVNYGAQVPASVSWSWNVPGSQSLGLYYEVCGEGISASGFSGIYEYTTWIFYIFVT